MFLMHTFEPHINNVCNSEALTKDHVQSVGFISVMSMLVLQFPAPLFGFTNAL